MLFYASIAVFSIAFFVSLEIVGFWLEYISILAPIFLVFVFLLSQYFGRSVALSFVPVFFAFSSTLLLFFVSAPSLRRVVTLLSSMVFYVGVLGIYRLRHYAKDVTARSMISLVSMASLFFFFSAFYAVFLNFQNFNVLLLMASYAAGTFFSSLILFMRFFPENVSRAWFFSAFLALFMAEVGWISTFWPFGYLTTGVLSVLFLSLPWDTVGISSSRMVSTRRLAFHSLCVLILLSLVLSSSVWLPVV